jgi:pyruvate dehydrogenase complex dehydrogenase (E1) component
MAQDGLASFEPAFVDELAVIMGWGFQYMQREGAGEGGSVYLRLSTRTIDQPQRIMTPDLQKGITDGALLAAQARRELRSRDRLYRCCCVPKRSRRSD